MIKEFDSLKGQAAGGCVRPALWMTILSQTEAAGAGAICSNCGAKLPGNAKFCLECGMRMGKRY